MLAFFALPGAGLLIMPLVMMRGARGSFPNLWIDLGIPALCLTTMFATFVFARRRANWIRRAVRASSGRSCVGCVYDLSGLGDSGVCPECGRVFDAAADRRAWERARII